ncbi:glycosyltransferase [soil metagenome]
MRFVLLYHSLISDWNHGNAHFLRGLMRALTARGHEAVCLEQEDNWSLRNLERAVPDAAARFHASFPDLRSVRYPAAGAEAALRVALREADVLIVHEWNEPSLIAAAPRLAREAGARPYFHGTHHRVVLDDGYRRRLALDAYEAILAYSPSLAERHRSAGAHDVRVFHEAADTTTFGPREVPVHDDVVFIGNYGDGDRDVEIEDYLFGPRRELPDLRFAVYGVRYPDAVVARMRDGLGVAYRGWLANTDVPGAYSAAKVALHIPRRQYVETLPGTPTIRIFEALASGACLISLPWRDTDRLFRAGTDYMVSHDPREMRESLAWLCSDAGSRDREGYRRNGRATILSRHTCGHRADELLGWLA